MPRYTPYTLKGRSVRKVFCDGVELSDVLEADDDLGFAVVLETDKQGHAILSGGERARRLVVGKIEVTFS